MLRAITILLVAAGLSGATTLPLVFEANQGQANPEVRYLAHTPKGTLWLTSRDAVLGTGSATLRIAFDGGNPKPQVRAEGPLPGKANYIVGNDPSKWHTHVPLFGKVRYRAVWPGIDVVFTGTRAIWSSISRSLRARILDAFDCIIRAHATSPLIAPVTWCWRLAGGKFSNVPHTFTRPEKRLPADMSCPAGIV